ncbi:MAG: VanZ family protein [Deltaproteobacteria bacterium]|jgi:VanZ family protein|nr:VanZ family protein [Deltaproteobacteria bacterium]
MIISPNTRTKNFFLYWLPLIFYCLLIFVQSCYPTTQSLPSIPYMDKLVHAGGYSLLGFLFYRAFQTTRIRGRAVMLILLSAFSATLYGISDEIHQYFVLSRTADIADVIADAAGGVVGAAGAYVVFNRGSGRLKDRTG